MRQSAQFLTHWVLQYLKYCNYWFSPIRMKLGKTSEVRQRNEVGKAMCRPWGSTICFYFFKYLFYFFVCCSNSKKSRMFDRDCTQCWISRIDLIVFFGFFYVNLLIQAFHEIVWLRYLMPQLGFNFHRI